MEHDILVKSKNKVKINKPRMYEVIMYNDDYTTMEFVIDILVNIFNKNINEAEKIMLQVHQNGFGIAGTYSYDIAITKVSYAMNLAEEEGFPFKIIAKEIE